MSEKLDKLRADLARARERRIQLNNRIELLERRIAEAEKVEVAEMVRRWRPLGPRSMKEDPREKIAE